ncbi:hypothetical protein KUCAC02_027328 [Chaenocephalus aceratus]|uniref:Uncharacterized protein n=1 Tax=Chaenocephalus aceratus TaxID=36190 RepID=A0ACB9W4I2_CHAAC|nr:hypothetical protein KUCAC02_027328 [Chaenocephalus aceratus]
MYSHKVSVQSCFQCFHSAGPFCSVLVERLGCRATVMLGGVLSGLGMAASSFTQSIEQLYITAGVITGLGFCFSFQPAGDDPRSLLCASPCLRQRHVLHGHGAGTLHSTFPG